MTTPKTAEEIVPLAARLAAVMGDLPNIEPEGFNAYFKYKFISDKQVLGALRPRLAKANIMLMPDVLSEQMVERAKSWVTVMHVKFTFIDGLTGETLSGTAIGYGDDSGDKGANKAFTAALKNFLLKTFLIGGDADIEDDSATDERSVVVDNVPVKVTDSKVKGVSRGGKTLDASSAQVKEVSRLSKQLQLGPLGLAALMELVLNTTIELPNDEVKASLMLATYLDGLSAEDMGKVITALNQAIEEREDAWMLPEDIGAK